MEGMGWVQKVFLDLSAWFSMQIVIGLRMSRALVDFHAHLRVVADDVKDEWFSRYN
jgi:hypothetical protein